MIAVPHRVLRIIPQTHEGVHQGVLCERRTDSPQRFDGRFCQEQIGRARMAVLTYRFGQQRHGVGIPEMAERPCGSLQSPWVHGGRRIEARIVSCIPGLLPGRKRVGLL